MKKKTLFKPEEPSEPINFIKSFNVIKKSAAFLLIFLLLSSSIAPALAAELKVDTNSTSTPGTTDSSDKNTANIDPVTENSSTDIVKSNQAPVEQKPESTVEKAPAVQQTLTSTDPDPRIDNGIQHSNIPYADETSGALVSDYPLTLPPGRNGFQPDLKLQYNSQNSNQIDSEFGAGWNINIPYIERVNKSGINNLYTTDTSTPVYFNSSLSGELIASTTATSTFSSRVDSGDFLNYKFENGSWTAKDKKGLTYYFGGLNSTSTASSSPELYNSNYYNDSNLLAYYRLENTSDSKGSYNLTNENSVSFAGAKFNNGATMGGNNTDKRLIVNNNMGLTAASNFTMSIWVKPNAQITSGTWCLFDHRSTTYQSYISIWYEYNAGAYRLNFLKAINGVGGVNNYYSYTLPTNSFTNLVLTYNGTTGTVTGYVNGAQVVQGSYASNSGGSGIASNSVSIGATGNGYLYSSAIFDDASIFGRSLTGYEVSDLYNGVWTWSSRQDNPSDYSQINKWMLDRVVDQNGNEVFYKYYKSGGQIYPSSVSYAGNTTSTPLYTVDFTRETRTDISTSSKLGFQVVTGSSVKDIQVKMNGNLMRKYDLSYTTGDNSRKALLDSITENGIDENGATTTLPSTLFTYQSENGGWASPGVVFPVTFQYAVLADINGDKYDDIIYAVTSSTTTTVATYLNNTNNGWATSTTYSSPVIFYGTGSNCNSSLCDKGIRVVDINGDGLNDLIGGQTYLNTGSGWTASSTWNSPIAFSNPNQNYGNNIYGDVGDVNGDGLNDVFRVYHNDSEEYHDVYFNNGNGFSSSTNWTVPLGIDKQITRLTTDFNGDGLTDLMQSLDYVPGADNKFTAINNGINSWATSTIFLAPIYFGANTQDSGVRVFDINGDGLPDINKSLASGGSDAYYGNGGGWTQSSGWASPLPFASDVDYNDQGTRTADLNGDGMSDIIQAKNDGFGGITSNARIITKKRVDLLTKITYSEGGSTNIVYKPSGTYKDGSNNLLNPKLPMNVDTVYQIINNDGNATTSTDTFTYKGGKYYFNGAFDRRLSGFNEIDKSDALGNVTKTFYHQGDTSASSTGEYLDSYWKIGKSYRIEKYDNASHLIEKTINKWDVATTSLGTGFVKLAQTIVSTYEGDAAHKDKAETYTYNNGTGNITQKKEYGQVTGSDDGSFTDTGTDDFITTYTYATSSTSTIISLLSSQTTIDHSSVKVKEFKLYYDNLNFGKTNKGNLTKREDWKTSSTYINSQKTYNSYGLVTTEIDPRGKVTNYSYDAYNLYPATVTSPLSLVNQYIYDYSSGKVKQTTDQNGNNFQNIYDGLDRLIEVKQPDPNATSTLVTKQIITYTDSRNGYRIQTTDYLTATTTADSYVYLDGLRRKKQERKEAEGSDFSVKDYAYDSRGLLQKESLPYFSSGSATTSPASATSLYINYYYDVFGRIATTTNAVGTTTNSYYDWQTKITDPNGKTKDLYTDAFGNLVKVDEHNATATYTTLYTYNYLGNLLSITDAANDVRNFTYDGLGRRLTAQDLHAPGDATYGSYTFTYDDAGNVTQKIDPKSQTVNYTYDDINRLLTEDYTGQGGTEVTNTYDSCTQGKGRQCTASSSAMTLANVYNALGQLTQETKVISGNSYSTTYSYDRQGNTIVITNPDSSQIMYLFNSAGQIEQVKRKESTDTSFIDVITDFDYSPTGQVTHIYYANQAHTINTYDSTKMYRLVRKLTTIPVGYGQFMLSQPDESLASAEFAERTIPTKVETKSITFPALKQATTSTSTLLGILTPDILDATSTTDSSVNASTTDLSSAPVEDVGSKEQATTTEESGQTLTPPVLDTSTTTEIASATPEIVPEQATSPELSLLNFFKSALSALVRATQALLALFLPPHAMAAATELYDTPLFNDANLISYWRAENVSDSKGTTTLTNNGSASFNPGKFNNGFDLGSSNTSKSFTKNNSNLGISGGAFSISLWVKLNSQPANGETYILSTLHDTNTKTTGTIYYSNTGSKVISFARTKEYIGEDGVYVYATLATSTYTHLVVTYDGTNVSAYLNGALQGSQSASGTGSTAPSVSSLGIGANLYDGGLSAFTSGIIDDVAVFNRALTSTEVAGLYNGISSGTDTAIQDINYTYDANGNITQLAENATSSLSRTLLFGYDDLNRLTSASTTAASTTPYKYTYTYNNLGNMMSRTENGTTTTYTYATNTAAYLNPHAVQKVGTATSTYDNNGNLLANIVGGATTTAYTWDYNNRMTQASSTGVSATYTYDPWGQRVKQVAGATTTIYSSKFYNITGATPTKHIFLPDGTMIATVIGTGTSTTVSYIHTDHLGGTNVATSDAGGVVELTDYYPYGSSRLDEHSGSFDEKRKFIGEVYDSSTGLNYLNARYYNGTNGKFISQDPAVKDRPENFLSDPQQQNYYSYARNNPITLSDPSGQCIWDGCIVEGALVIGAIIGAGVGYFGQPRTANAPAPGEQTYRSASDGEIAFNTGVSIYLGELTFGTAAVEYKTAQLYNQQLANEIQNGTNQELTVAPSLQSTAAGQTEGGKPVITKPYQRPANATTQAQRLSVQGKPCADCGATAPLMVADHKTPLVKEYYGTGGINLQNMRSIDAVQPQCTSCSNIQGGQLSNYSKQMKVDLKLNK